MDREMNRHMYDVLREHMGHEIEIAAYGDSDNPRSVCIECIECCSVLFEAFCDEDYDENFNEGSIA